jgi:hypothetical protein
VDNINLGTSATAKGNNVIKGNVPDLCLASAYGTLHAEYNQFDATVCASGTTVTFNPPNNCTTVSRIGLDDANSAAVATQFDLLPCGVQ